MTADRVVELASHLTERDREIVLFFSSTRPAQDRLLFLYPHLLLDCFYPPSPFGAGKPQPPS